MPRRAQKNAHAGARDFQQPLRIWIITSALLLSGNGCAVINAQITAAAVSTVPAERTATAAAICVTMRQIGFALGIALIGAVLKTAHKSANSVAFSAVGTCTLVLAAFVFVLLHPSTHSYKDT